MQYTQTKEETTIITTEDLYENVFHLLKSVTVSSSIDQGPLQKDIVKE